MNNTKAVAKAIADELEKSVGLYRKLPDGRMVEMHVKKIAIIQTSLRQFAAPSPS